MTDFELVILSSMLLLGEDYDHIGNSNFVHTMISFEVTLRIIWRGIIVGLSHCLNTYYLWDIYFCYFFNVVYLLSLTSFVFYLRYHNVVSVDIILCFVIYIFYSHNTRQVQSTLRLVTSLWQA